MAHFPPKAPPNTTQNWQYSLPSQMMHITSCNNTTWVDEFLDFSSVRRNAYRRSATDSIAFLPLLEECPTSPPPPTRRTTAVHGGSNGGFDRLDNEQLMSMFADGNPSTPSDHNSNDEEKPLPPHDDHHQKMKKLKEEPREVDDGSSKSDPPTTTKPFDNAGDGSTVVDPRRVKRWFKHRIHWEFYKGSNLFVFLNFWWVLCLN